MLSRLISPTGKRKTLSGVRPNVGIEVSYRRRLDALITEMHRSIMWWIAAAYRRAPPILAQDDDMPGRSLQDEMESLAHRWQNRFDDMAHELGARFARAAIDHADGAMTGQLRRSLMSVKFTMTPAARQVMAATVASQVSLIKSIASEHLGAVQGSVMRSVQVGRDLATLTQEIEARYGLTRKRAATIAHHQNNLATASITRARQIELGIDQAVWLHSRGGRVPRPSHVANNGKLYDVSIGWFDPDEKQWIFPGQLIRCRCVSKPVIQGFG